MWIVYSTAAVFVAFILDNMFGDPNVWWHPICLIGKLISKVEKLLRKKISKGNLEKVSPEKERVAGIFLVVIVTIVSTIVPVIVLVATYKVHAFAGFLTEAFLGWFLLAGKCLATESKKVATALENEGIEGGRYAVSMIVGRDTSNLTKEGVIKATVETVAENTSDGIIAPFFYMLIGGIPLGFLYKSINTMDSMVGYKNDKYINFGRFAAKTDDVANFVPSRISGVFMILASYVGGFNGKNAFRIFIRDRKKHASPNAGNTESVMAGALGVQLAGNAVYFDKLYEKPYIGDFLRPVEIKDIERSAKIMFLTSLLFAITGFILKGLVLLCMNMAGIFIIM